MNARVRALDPAHHADIVSADPESDGWHDVEYGPVEGCGHIETMCKECVDRWRIDYEVHFAQETSS